MNRNIIALIDSLNQLDSSKTNRIDPCLVKNIVIMQLLDDKLSCDVINYEITSCHDE